MTLLHHLTLNSGDVAQTPRSVVDQTVIDALRPMIENFEGGWPALGIGFDLYRPWNPDRTPIQGAAIFNIIPWPKTDSDLVYVTGFCCWKDDVAEMAWTEVWDMVETYRQVMEPAGDPILAVQAVPPQTPWLAVLVFPTALLHLDRDRVLMLGDLERCLFWTLAEGN